MMRLAFVLLALSLVACKDEAVNFAGSYTINTTNGQNGCNFGNWTVGETTTGIPATATQSDHTVTIVINGLLGTYLDLALGSRTFIGEADGTFVQAALQSRDFTQNACIYKYIATMHGELDGDFLSGDIDYSTATNASPDCGTLENCHTSQTFNGTRPPTQ